MIDDEAKRQAFQAGFAKGFQSCKTETDKAIRALCSAMSGLTAGVQLATEPQVITVRHDLKLDGDAVKRIATQVTVDMFGEIVEAIAVQPDEDDPEASPAP